MTDGLTPSPPQRSRRTFSEPTGKGEVDLAARARMVKILAFSPVGALLGFIFGLRAGYEGGAGILFLLVSVVVGWALAFFGPFLAMQVGGAVAGTVYNPSGSRVPPKREYSQAEAYVAQGRYQEAIDAFEIAVMEHPEEPEPYLRIARVYRDELDHLEDAARWFKRVRREAELPDGMKLLVIRELVELYVDKLGTPAKALPELARMAELQAGTAEGDWAAQELRRLKHGDDETPGTA